MSAPRDGRTQQGRGGRDPHRGMPPADPNQVPAPAQAGDPYLDETYARDPYAEDPYDQTLYDQSRFTQAPPQQPQGPYAQAPYPQQQAPYQQDSYPQAPVQQQAPYLQTPQDQQAPYAPAGYEQAPYQQPGYQQAQQPPYSQPAEYPEGATVPGYGPPQGYQQAPPPHAGDYGNDPAQGYAEVGLNELISHATEPRYQPAPPQDTSADPYGYLFRDSGGSGPDNTGTPGDIVAETSGTIPLLRIDPATAPPTGTADGTAAGGKKGGILGSSALMAAGTLVSRGTGFLRTIVIAFAIGTFRMGDSYNAANTLPTLLYILVGGGALNAVFVPQLVRSMKNDEDGGEAYANRLLTLVVIGLGGVVFVTVLAAPLLVRLVSQSLMSDPQSADVTVSLARYCLPTIFFMGVHVVMGQILNARGRFGAMMWTPVLNNIVVIFTFAMYAWVFGPFHTTGVKPQTISPEGVRLLGIGTLLGLVVQALSMIPYLRAAGFRFRPRFDWRGHGLGHAAKLAKWTFLFVLANQAGFLVVTQLATAAGAAAGPKGAGLSAYSNALLIWQLPQAVITVSVMSAVLPRISRSAADGEAAAVRDDLSYGLRTSAVAIVPAAFLFLSLGPVIGALLYGFGGSGQGLTIGFMLSAFALGLIPYSAQYVLLRGFYAYEDTRTPFYNTVWVAATMAALSGVCYLVLPAKWAVTGMAFAYGFSYLVGLLVALPRLKRRIGDLDGARIKRTYGRLIGAAIGPAVIGAVLAWLIIGALGSSFLGNLAALIVGGGLQLALFVVIAQRMRVEELTSLIGMVRAKIGR